MCGCCPPFISLIEEPNSERLLWFLISVQWARLSKVPGSCSDIQVRLIMYTETQQRGFKLNTETEEGKSFSSLILSRVSSRGFAHVIQKNGTNYTNKSVPELVKWRQSPVRRKIMTVVIIIMLIVIVTMIKKIHDNDKIEPTSAPVQKKKSVIWKQKRNNKRNQIEYSVLIYFCYYSVLGSRKTNKKGKSGSLRWWAAPSTINIDLRFPKKYLKYQRVWYSGFSRTGVVGELYTWKHERKCQLTSPL